MSEFHHVTVLLHETTAALAPKPGGIYVDCTLGGGGHTERLLEMEPSCTVVGIDKDPAALAAAQRRLARFGDRLRLVHGAFAHLPAHLTALGYTRVDGILADLGVSSPQLDQATRGFSFSQNGPLDMRMDPTQGRTARELILALSPDALADVLADYGEERHARRLARAIKAAAEAGGLHTTAELVTVVQGVIPIVEQRKFKIHPATRTFQGLRIAVNRELEELETLLAAFPDLLQPQGRCAIISFHSLEDRLVKHRFRDLAWTTSLPAAYATQAGERVAPVCTLVHKKSLTASDAEIAANPRARSAHLRVCERTDAPNLPAHQDGVSRHLA